MSSLALEHALAAASCGLAVLPLSRTKLPALRSPHRARETTGAVAGAPATPRTNPEGLANGSAEPPEKPCHGECGLFGHGVHDATTDPVWRPASTCAGTPGTSSAPAP